MVGLFFQVRLRVLGIGETLGDPSWIRSVSSSLLALFVVLALVGCDRNATETQPAEVPARIAVAANFVGTAAVLRDGFVRQGGAHFEIVPGSTGKLFSQIEHGAPLDAFFSADERRPDELIRRGRAERARRTARPTGPHGAGGGRSPRRTRGSGADRRSPAGRPSPAGCRCPGGSARGP